MPTDGRIDESMLRGIMKGLDSDGDGTITKEEYKVPYMKLFPKMTAKEYDATWKKMDKNGDGSLSFEELATYYGFSLTAAKGDDEMSDEQILEALQMQSLLNDMTLRDLTSASGSRSDRSSPKQPRAAARRRSRIETSDEWKINAKALELVTIKMPNSVSQSEKDPNILFLMACDVGDEKELLDLLRVDAKNPMSVRVIDEKGECPLHKLARHGLMEPIRRVFVQLASSASGNRVELQMQYVNWQDKQGKTALHYAAEFGHVDLINMFVDMEADMMAEDAAGWTVLHTAVNANNDSVVAAVLQHPKSPRKTLISYKDFQERTALHIAAFKENGEVTRLLVTAGAKPDALDATGHTPLHLAKRASRGASVEIIEAAVAAAAALKGEAYPPSESAAAAS